MKTRFKCPTALPCLVSLVLSACGLPGADAQPLRKPYRPIDGGSGLAPRPEDDAEAIVHVYAARTYSWRGYFAVHTWIASKGREAIPKIHEAALDYPYPFEYRAWPGPNSNTFISHILRKVPEIGVELPPHAIGKDWLEEGNFVGTTESGTGIQFSLFGLLGFTVGLAEGVEFNILGLNFGLDFARPALKLPLVGRLGMSDAPLFDD